MLTGLLGLAVLLGLGELLAVLLWPTGLLLPVKFPAMPLWLDVLLLLTGLPLWTESTSSAMPGLALSAAPPRAARAAALFAALATAGSVLVLVRVSAEALDRLVGPAHEVPGHRRGIREAAVPLIGLGEAGLLAPRQLDLRHLAGPRLITLHLLRLP